MKKLSLAQLNSKSIKTLVAKTATTAAKKVAASAGKQSNHNYNLLGLELVDEELMPTLTNGDRVGDTRVYHLGNREWTIEVYDHKGSFIKEFTGFGSSYEHEPEYLWRKFDKWCTLIYKHSKNIKKFKAPDGKEETLEWFYREADKHRLHGLTMQFF